MTDASPGCSPGPISAVERRSFPRRRTMRARLAVCLFAAVLGCWSMRAPIAMAQEVIAYPARGQSPDQQSRDRYECHAWAVQQSGFDPSQQAAQAPPPSAPPSAVTTSPLQGAARGAAVGAVGGAIGGDAGKGAAVGAGTGALIGGIRRREQVQQQQAYQQQSAQTRASGSSATYNRALKTCLQGRGYTVN